MYVYIYAKSFQNFRYLEFELGFKIFCFIQDYYEITAINEEVAINTSVIIA